MSKHTPGPWFLWKERAMQDEGMEPEEITEELLEFDYFEVMSGTPIGEVRRGLIKGCKQVVELDADDFGDDVEEGRQVALANARLIAAAPDLLAALQAVLHWIDDNCETTGFDAAEAMADAALAKAGAELFNTERSGAERPPGALSSVADRGNQ